MLLPIEVWFPAFWFAFKFGVAALVVDALLQPRKKRQPSPPTVVEDVVDQERAA